MAPQLAWIGLGNMGSGMCKNLVEKGNLPSPLIIQNRTAKRAEDLSSSLGSGKTKVVASIADAVDSADIIFYCLGDDKSVTDSVETMMKSNVKGKLFVDCSTIHPDTTAAEAKTIEGHGASFVASPVFGAPAMAQSGQLVFVLAGNKDAIEKAKPYTKGVMGRDFIDYSGQPPSKATLMKIIGNTFIINMVETLAEGHTIAEKTGLGSDDLHQFIEKMFPGPFVAYSNRMMTGDYYGLERPKFQIDLARKDARHALNLAETSGVKMRAVEVGADHLNQVKDHDGGHGDLAGIYGAVRKESGLKFENGKKKNT